MACIRSSVIVDAGPFLDLLQQKAPDAKWGEALQVNMDEDKMPDAAVLGRTRKEVLLAVVLTSNPSNPFIFKFPWSPRVPDGDGVCADPSKARILVEERLADSNAPRSWTPKWWKEMDKGGSGPFELLEAVQLDAGGDCKMFHFYFDGKAVTWWRGVLRGP